MASARDKLNGNKPTGASSGSDLKRDPISSALPLKEQKVQSDPYKQPKLVGDMQHLQNGDIVVFGPRFDEAKADFVTRAFQFVVRATSSLRSNKHGHADSTHMGTIRVEQKDGKEIIRLVHVTEGNPSGHVDEPLDDALKRVGGDRAARIFRLNDPNKGKKLAEFAADKKIHGDTKWTAKAALAAGGLPSSRGQKTAGMRKETVCSGFIADCIENSGIGIKFGINTLTIPKVIESKLATHPDFDIFIFPGKVDLFQETKKTIEIELEKMASKAGTRQNKKYSECSQTYKKAISILEDTPNKLTTLDKTLALLKFMFKPLSVHTGTIGSKSSSVLPKKAHKYPGALRRILKAARARRLFLKDIEGFNYEAALKIAEKRAPTKNLQTYNASSLLVVKKLLDGKNNSQDRKDAPAVASVNQAQQATEPVNAVTSVTTPSPDLDPLGNLPVKSKTTHVIDEKQEQTLGYKP